MAVHFSLSVGLSLPIHPSISLHKRHLFSPSACQLGEKTGLFLGGGGKENLKSEQRRKKRAKEQEGECAGKKEGEEGEQPEEWGNGRDAWGVEGWG